MTKGLVLLLDTEYFEITDEAVPGILPRTYFVNRNGQVYSTLSNRLMQPTLNNDKYQALNFRTVNGKSRGQLLHRIMMITFSDHDEQHNVVNHIDGKKGENDDLSNLEWTNNDGNLEHAQSNNLLVTGEDCSWSKLTEKEVREICQHFVDKDYGNVSELARQYNVHHQTIIDIANRLTWKNVSGDYDFVYSPREHFTEEQVKFICETFVRFKGQSFSYCYYYCLFTLNLPDNRNIRTRILKLYRKDPSAFAHITSQYDY